MKQKDFLWIVVVLAALTSPLPGVFAADSASDEQQLKKIEQEWANAYVKRDTGYAVRMTTEDFAFTGPDGVSLNKTDYISSLSNQVEFKQFTIDQARVRVYGTTAVVIGLGSIKARFENDELNEKYSWTDVFVKQDGEWKRAAGHVTMVAQK